VARDRPCSTGKFSKNGKIVVTVPRTLKTDEDQVTRDAIVTEATSAGTSTLKEIDFGHQKEALVFDQNPGGMQLQPSLDVDPELRTHSEELGV
jgi:hypothetical protein